MTLEYIENLTKAFELQRNDAIAQQQKAYMKDKFDFFGLKTPVRRDIQKPFLEREFLPNKEEAFEIIQLLWKKNEREYHYFAQELFMKYKKKLDVKDVDLIEYLVTHNSWWDTVDLIATHMAGEYFKRYPEQIKDIITKWSISENMWLRRTAILFQLKYKSDTNTELMSDIIEKNLGSKEFFINKAIGWVLRDYSRVDSNWVIQFVEDHPQLSNLSKKEALRLLG